MLARERNEIAGNKNSFMGSIVNEGRQMTEKERENFRRPPYWPALNAKKNKEEQKNGESK